MARYTAQEMRTVAKSIEADIVMGPITDMDDLLYRAMVMLRQAADAMEREKDYEYTVIAKKHDGEVFLDTEHFSTLEGVIKNAEDSFYDVLRYNRREVGKWEEVK